METKEKNVIELLIDERKKYALNKYGNFNSRHEAYGIALEEIQELYNEVEDIKVGICSDYWRLCRKSKVIKYGDNEAIRLLDCLGAAIICAIDELIDIAAAVKKAKILEYENK